MFHFQRKILEILLSTGYLPLTFHSMFFFILAWEYWSTTKGEHIKKKKLHSYLSSETAATFVLCKIKCSPIFSTGRMLFVHKK